MSKDPKFETNSNFQKSRKFYTAPFRILNLVFAGLSLFFGFRYSDFGFCFVPRRSGKAGRLRLNFWATSRSPLHNLGRAEVAPSLSRSLPSHVSGQLL
jgi:hypothetical protein